MARQYRRVQAGHVQTTPRRGSRSQVQPSGVTSWSSSGVVAHSAQLTMVIGPYVGPAPLRCEAMASRRRRSTGNPELDRRLDEVLDAVSADGDRDLLFEILATGVRLADDAADRLDLKICAATLKEMREAFRIFAPYRLRSKVTIFGSARTTPDDPLYAQARAFAAAMAQRDWMVVTGAGPGIMAAGMEGAGRERSFGVAIRLPFEQLSNPFIADDVKLVSMKYFFTRKLMLVKESKAFVCLPGGFGTLDETFELLTLTQTGKGVPVPIVLLDVPGGTYWSHFSDFVRDELVSRGFVEPSDLRLYVVTDDIDQACEEVSRFYVNFDSLRYVGDTLVMRMLHEPTDEQLADLNARFQHLLRGGTIERTAPLPVEVDDDDSVELPRIRLEFARRYVGQLRDLIDAVNSFGPAHPSSMS
jgi:uncharacterized protein (TIGR00730 family)